MPHPNNRPKIIIHTDWDTGLPLRVASGDLTLEEATRLWGTPALTERYEVETVEVATEANPNPFVPTDHLLSAHAEMLRAIAPHLTDPALEMILASLATGEASLLAGADGTWRYDDPQFGPPVDLTRLAYDAELGLVVVE